MIDTLLLYESHSVDPHYNLALEKHLLDMLLPGQCILYLWQNQNTVVIGSNQNPWNECRISALEADGGKLARRLSGGGAVYHDLGNLNFTFLMGEEDYDIQRQLAVVRNACERAGIHTEPSGRNDLLADGKKFSGNAFYHHQGKAYHHGTLLINTDVEKMQRYLSPPKAKLEAKGVSSVRARVVNLSELTPGLTCEKMKKHMKEAFSDIYKSKSQQIRLTVADLDAISRLAHIYSGWDHLFGKPLPFSFRCEKQFPWGHIDLQLHTVNGIIKEVKVYSDMMEWDLPCSIEASLTDCRFTLQHMQQALQKSDLSPAFKQDLSQMLNEQDI